MGKGRTPEWIQKFINDIHEHQVKLPDSPDHILVILKGHLLVEQEINRLLETKVPNPDALGIRKRSGPTFFHKLRLLRALIPKPEPVPDLWNVVEELNKLRNDLAHELSPENVEESINRFTSDVINTFEIAKYYHTKSQRVRLQTSILLIVHRLTCLTNC